MEEDEEDVNEVSLPPFLGFPDDKEEEESELERQMKPIPTTPTLQRRLQSS